MIDFATLFPYNGWVTTRERTPMEPTKIQWSLGYTKNLGNFESLRLDCQVSDYIRDEETARVASDRIYKLVEDELMRKLKEVQEELS